MTYVNFLKIAAGTAALATAAQAQAQSIPFSGMISGIGAGSPDPTCAPATARGILLLASSTGTSNVGSFTYGHNWCFNGPVGPINGTFDMFFGSDNLQGTLTGVAGPSGTVGLTNLNLTYTILSGTGAFTGATGSFGGIATADVRGRSPTAPLFKLNFTGNLSAPALPEPGTWMMMLLGFGSIGFAMRRNRREQKLAQIA